MTDEQPNLGRAVSELGLSTDDELDFGGHTPLSGREILDAETESIVEEIERLKTERPPNMGHGKPGDVAYVPVADSMLSYVQKLEDNGTEMSIGGKTLNWWLRDSLAPMHPFILLNPMTLSDRSYHYDDGIVRKHLRLDRESSYVLADSGGFQIATRPELEIVDDINKHDAKNYIHPKRILQWQIANADSGTILDVPPFNYAGDGPKFLTHDFDEWHQDVHAPALAQTVKNTEKTIQGYEEIGYDHFDLIAVLHGMPRQDGLASPYQTHYEWFKALDDMHDWDGWSIASGSADGPGLLTFSLAFAQEYIDVPFIHVLGQGNIWARILSKLYAQLTDTFITHDGTGFKIGSMYSAMYMPTTYMKSLRVTEREWTPERDDDRYEWLDPKKSPCGCSVCMHTEQHVGWENLFADEMNKTRRMLVMDLHNLNHLMRRFRFIDAFIEARGTDLLDEIVVTEEGREPFPLTVHPKSEFWKILDSWLTSTRVAEIYFAMDFLVTAIEDDIDAALDKYWLRTPFYNINHGPRKRKEKASIRPYGVSSVFDW